jgi:hypothetical protein
MERPTPRPQWCVKNQLIDDDVSGLTFRFDILPSGEPILKLYGAILPHGNRQIRFSPSGDLQHFATSVLGVERPNWPRRAEQE